MSVLVSVKLLPLCANRQITANKIHADRLLREIHHDNDESAAPVRALEAIKPAAGLLLLLGLLLFGNGNCCYSHSPINIKLGSVESSV
ncbi:hypothetical protein CCHR01_00353 [Colletotrichum chrysophilum]|uniref:Uncharacterized protein n=1 Tax=Colletotrichum chrysophilum TaxID=1836956 RepID=A0AAD9EQ55_9PEZI|nr:hypothetical protein CCHR01_00353 [Colletotrichum chrysophilum]